MSGFCFYKPGLNLRELEALASELKIPCIELDEAFQRESRQALLRARYESGLRYACLHLQKPISAYSKDEIQKAALWCEANYVEAILFTSPGESVEAAVQAMAWLDDFRIDTVFENRIGSFLTTPDDMEAFFRGNKGALLCFNAAEMVSQRIHPFLTALNGKHYRRQLYMVRVQDRSFNGEDALPGCGDAELAEIFSAAAGFGRNLFASVAPYAGFPPAEIKTHMCGILCRI